MLAWSSGLPADIGQRGDEIEWRDIELALQENLQGRTALPEPRLRPASLEMHYFQPSSAGVGQSSGGAWAALSCTKSGNPRSSGCRSGRFPAPKKGR